MNQLRFRTMTRPHPVMLAAAVSLITFSLLGIGAITGVIPSARSDNRQEIPRSELKGMVDAPALSRQPMVSTCTNCGVVDAVREVRVNDNPSGLGAVTGGIAGALIGNQVGNGHGRDAMTLLGGIGGAFAGHSIEKNIKQRTAYRITVRMDDGSMRTISQSHAPAIIAGSKVRITNGMLEARS